MSYTKAGGRGVFNLSGYKVEMGKSDLAKSIAAEGFACKSCVRACVLRM